MPRKDISSTKLFKMNTSLKIVVLMVQLAVLVNADHYYDNNNYYTPNSNRECYEMNASKKCCTKDSYGYESCFTTSSSQYSSQCTKCCTTSYPEKCFIASEHHYNNNNNNRSPSNHHSHHNTDKCYYKDNNCKYCCNNNGYESCSYSQKTCRNYHNSPRRVSYPRRTYTKTYNNW